MVRSLVIVSVLVVSQLCATLSHAAQQPCSYEQSVVNYNVRQVQYAQSRLTQQQNALISLQNRTDSRTLSLQLQVDQALAWKQSVGGMRVGNSVGCAIRTIFWGYGGCFAGVVSQNITMQARANANYNLAVNRLTTFQNSSAMQIARYQQQVAIAQIQYDAAVSNLQVANNAYQECLAQQ